MIDNSFKRSFNAVKWGIFRNGGLIGILLILIIICLIIIPPSQQCTNIGTSNILCDDSNDCTFDYSQKNQSCINYNKPNGAACDNAQLCFNHSLCTPQCDLCSAQGCPKTPQCVGPRSCCLGLCTVDDDCIDKVTFLTEGVAAMCVTGSCYYQIFNTLLATSQQCLNLVEGPIKQCLYATAGESFSFNGVCYFNFLCAPPLTGGIP